MNKKNEKQKAEHIEVDKSTLTPLTTPGLKGHRWIQKGPFLICQSCPIEHATYIGTSHLFAGVNEEGIPLLKRIEISR